MSPTLTSEELKKKREKFIIGGVKQLYDNPPHIVSGKGQFLYDENGRQYPWICLPASSRSASGIAIPK